MGELESQPGAGEVASREKPIPVLEGLRLVDDACGTQALVDITIPSVDNEPSVPVVPQEPKM